MTLEDSIHRQRLRVLRDAERLGNVRRPAGAMGCRGRCSIGCVVAWRRTDRTAFTRSAARGDAAARRLCRSKRSGG
jgi:hypothetical protein